MTIQQSLGIGRAVAALQQGGVIAFPTETVWGLGALAGHAEALARLFALKARPRINPLIVHVDCFERAAALGEFGPRGRALAELFWPGPLSLVVPRRRSGGVHRLATAGLSTVALRVPGHEQARAMLEALGAPVAAPSANRSGALTSVDSAMVRRFFGDAVPVFEWDPPTVGLESTVIMPNDSGGAPILLRPGAVARELIEEELGEPLLLLSQAEQPQSPGQLLQHYAPAIPLELVDAMPPRPVSRELAVLDFGGSLAGGDFVAYCDLSPREDLTEAAARLFSALDELAQSGARGIAARLVPERGLGIAINDRLRRAASLPRAGAPAR